MSYSCGKVREEGLVAGKEGERREGERGGRRSRSRWRRKWRKRANIGK